MGEPTFQVFDVCEFSRSITVIDPSSLASANRRLSWLAAMRVASRGTEASALGADAGIDHVRSKLSLPPDTSITSLLMSFAGSVRATHSTAFTGDGASILPTSLPSSMFQMQIV